MMREQVPTARRIRVSSVVWQTLRHPDAVAAALAFIRTVLKDFFWLQFSVKWGLRRVPLVSVDHPLDETVPFAPDRVGVYLDFIAFWIRPVGYLGRRFGRDAQRRATVTFLGLIDRCYREAAHVYRQRMSTTNRPRYYRGRFLAIHLFDPHYLCVPSLHVMIVVLTWAFHRQAMEELGAGADEAAALDRELFDGAVEITETVLAIKQHSVNCIPAALYAMSRITPDALTTADIEAFTDALFRDDRDVREVDAARLRQHVLATFRLLRDDGRGDDAWPVTVLRALETAPPARR